ncbi:MAG: two-CW domain-containing protein [bacterium]
MLLRKLNCWEYKNCGREKGGVLAEVLGECPVSTAMKFDGLNDGIAVQEGPSGWFPMRPVAKKSTNFPEP